MFRIESFLSARLFLVPQLADDYLYFVSNISGHLSLYRMKYGGSVPEPLLPPDIAMQNPHLVEGNSFYVFPQLGIILVMLDQDGNEKYQPMTIPLEGGYPEPYLAEELKDYKVYLGHCDPDRNIAYFFASSLNEPMNVTYKLQVENKKLTKIFQSPYGGYPAGHNAEHSKVAIVEGYTMGDHVLYLWDEKQGNTTVLAGTPLQNRKPEEKYPLNSIHSCHFTTDDRYLVFHTTLFDDKGGLGIIDLDSNTDIMPVEVTGLSHEGVGELSTIEHLDGDKYALAYNIDGCDYVYEGYLNPTRHLFTIEHKLIGFEELSSGVVEHLAYDKKSDRFIFSFSTATSPTQIYSISGPTRSTIERHTNERILGIPERLLSKGEDASYVSFDGTRISARLYLPSSDLNYSQPFPLVYYIHGGPQSQERPDFSWFSMPLIQYLTLMGFAVFVPNVRGSTGYGLSYTKQVDRDWGGNDRLDHVFAMTEVLPKDSRLDTGRAGVVGRSYGGYMTLTLAARHPELWKAAVDMFGPYDLITFSERIPETWKPYFAMVLGDPKNEQDRQFLIQRSPKTYIEQIQCPLLVIQGRNDPRVVEQESRDLIEHLRSIGKTVEFIVYPDEGHDVLKFKNRVHVYTSITEFFRKHLQ